MNVSPTKKALARKGSEAMTAPIREPVILCEDQHLLLVSKPQGMPSQPDPSGQVSLLAYLAERYPNVGIVHRLDTPTGGVMVFAKTQAMTGKLATLFNNRENFEKVYLAVLSSPPAEPQGALEDYLYHDKRQNKAFVVTPAADGTVRKGAKAAKLTYEVLETLTDDLTLVRVKLYTGRTHQIRIQFASRGCPVAGDGKYGSRVKCPFIALWSHSLTFKHPVTGNTTTVTDLPPGETEPWERFGYIFRPPKRILGQ